MSKRLACLLAGAIATGLFMPPAAGADESARQVMVKLERLLRADTNTGRYLMRVHTKDWDRSIELDDWDDRPGKRFFIRILKPAKDRGTAYLKDGPNLWMYMPKLERDIRIPPSMMLSSWMGSDFTNDDLVKAESVVDDYTHRIIAHKDGVLTVESIPKPDAPVVWGKLVHRIRDDGIPLQEDFYDEHGKLVRSLTFEDVREIGGRRIPTRWVMQPLDEPGKQTVLTIESITFNVPIPASVFTRQNLRRGVR